MANADEFLRISLKRRKQNPAIKAIEIIQLGTDLAEFVDSSIKPPQENDSQRGDTENMHQEEVNDTIQDPRNELPATEEIQIIEEQPLTGRPDSTRLGGNIEYRINIGGPTIGDSVMNWDSDASASKYVSTGKKWSTNTAVDTSNLPGDTPASLFSTARWNRKSGKKLQWKLPVEPGQYRVNLYFAEIWSGAMAPGKRVFHVEVEDQVLRYLDVYAEVGGYNAMVKTFVVNSDSILNIALLHEIQNPSIKGIEVLRLP